MSDVSAKAPATPDSPATLPERLRVTVAYLLLVPFFLSGAAALIAQMGWLRILTVGIGGSANALNIVLITFMGGLAIGAWLARSFRQDSLLRYVLLYVVLELILSVYIFLSGPIIATVTGLYDAMAPRLGHETLLENLTRLVVVGSSLLLPTVVMGMTTPVLIAATVRHQRETAANAGLLYGMNTFGAAVGSLVASGYLILQFGVARSLKVAGLLNATAALIAFAIALLLTRFPAGGVVDDPAAEAAGAAPAAGDEAQRFGVGQLCFLAAAGGFLGMALEVIFARMLAFVIGSSHYSKAVAISGFLFGIVAGSLLVGIVARRRRPAGGTLPWVLCAAGAATIVSSFAFENLPSYLDALFRRAALAGQPLVLLKLIAAVSIVALPAMASGILLPYLVQMVADRTHSVSGGASRVLFWNTIGSVLGVAITGYALIEWLGVRRTLYTAALVIFVLAAYTLVRVAPRTIRYRHAATVFIVGGCVACLWLIVGRGGRPLVVDSLAYERVGSPHIVYYAEDDVASVTGVAFDRKGSMGLMINGLMAGRGDKRHLVQEIVPLFTMLTHEDPESFFLAGIASGRTAGTAGLFPGLAVTAVEISSAAIGALPYLAEFNDDVASNPSVVIVHGDARHYLRATEERFDLIAPDVYISAATGTAYLYNQEFFELCAARLNPGGRTVLNIYLETSPIDRVIAAGFVRSFPYVDLVQIPYDDYAFLVGANEPIVYPKRPWERWTGQAEIMRQMDQLGIEESEGLQSFLRARRPDLLRKLQGVTPSTDDHPIVDYIQFSSPAIAWRK